jgi:hypothetical protein
VPGNVSNNSRIVGIATWFASAAAALALARTVVARARLPLAREALAVSLAAALFGLAATALDFGGWNEPDWRAAVFVFCGAATAIPLVRALSL